jgi:adenine-specific DNA glycosylase
MNLTSAPKSPLDLGQEQFPDPWSHLVCCILCSRTTGGPLIRATIRNFIAQWPSPSAVLSATEDDLVEAINPLGLQLNRIKALKSMSNDFLAKDWVLPSEFSGCGKFTADSWRIFCRGHRSLEDVEDKNLRRYLHWLLNKDTSNLKNKSEKTRNLNDGKTFKEAALKTRSRVKRQSTGAGSSTVRKTAARGMKNNSSRRQTRSSTKE